MTYLELYEKATKLVDSGEITIGEYEKMIEPLNTQIAEWIPMSESRPKGIKPRMAEDANV